MTLFDLPRLFVLAWLFIFGCCFGSFLNVCIHRFPSRHTLREQLRSLASHSSGCPRCSAAILWRDNIPILGWLLLAGRCRNCKRPISFRYPLVECLTGCLFVILYQLEMPPHFWASASDTGLFSTDGPQNLTQHLHLPLWLHIRYLLHVAMICCLIAASFIDMEHWIIPDGTTVPMMIVALATHTTCGQAWILPLWFQDQSVASVLQNVAPPSLQPLLFSWDCLPFAIAHPHWHGLLVSLTGLVVGGGTVWLVRILGAWAFKREAMGFGDVVLMAMIGSVIGWQPVLVVFLLAPIPAIAAAVLSLVLRRRDEIPYGPWLSFAALTLLLAWRSIWPVAERFFDLGPVLLFMAILMTLLLAVSLQLSQLLRKLLGWTPATAPEIIDDGIPMIYPADKSDPAAGQWPRELWPGIRSGQGLHANHQWRSPR
jgi:leader peptidase (prepilin peptidase)/N-methyltransferase